MTRSMFFLVTEETFNQGTEDEFVGYRIGTKQIPKSKFLQVATHNSKAIVLYMAPTDAQYKWASQQEEFLAGSYQQLILDSQFGFSNALIAKKCMNVEYTDPTTEETVRSSVYDWELAGFPGEGTHRYHKAVKIYGQEVE